MAWLRRAGLAAGMAMGTWAHAQDWAAVEHLKRGTEIVIETTPAQSGMRLEHTCRLVTSDANGLTCTALHGAGLRLVLPAGKIRTVYRVRRRRVSAGLLAELGFAVGAGAVFATPAVAIVSMTLLVAALVVAVVHSVEDLSDFGYGMAGQPGERLKLVYSDGFTP